MATDASIFVIFDRERRVGKIVLRVFAQFRLLFLVKGDGTIF
jgi:hypothetical protein